MVRYDVVAGQNGTVAIVAREDIISALVLENIETSGEEESEENWLFTLAVVLQLSWKARGSRLGASLAYDQMANALKDIPNVMEGLDSINPFSLAPGKHRVPIATDETAPSTWGREQAAESPTRRPPKANIRASS